MSARQVLDPAQRRFLASARTATLATMATDGRPRLVPVCFVLGEALDEVGRDIVYSPIDEKPKTEPDPLRLARSQDILVLPDVTILVDRWDEDWSKLAWLRAYGTGQILEPQPHEAEEHTAAVRLLREKYPQYREQRLEERPIIRIALQRAVAWGAIG